MRGGRERSSTARPVNWHRRSTLWDLIYTPRSTSFFLYCTNNTSASISLSTAVDNNFRPKVHTFRAKTSYSQAALASRIAQQSFRPKFPSTPQLLPNRWQQHANSREHNKNGTTRKKAKNVKNNRITKYNQIKWITSIVECRRYTSIQQTLGY